jgi:hypothetical protein
MTRTAATRFSGLTRWAALAGLAALSAFIAWGLPMAGRLTPLSPSAQSPDIQYYRSVIAVVRTGEPYEPAALRFLRDRHAATTPFFTVRPPILAWMLAWLPGDYEKLADLMLAGLAGTVVGVWLWRLSRLRWDAAFLVRAGLILIASVAVMMRGHGLSYIHEAWAGLLIAASLAVRSDRRFAMAVALGLAAALIRELALPYLAVMALAALFERRWREAGAFGMALAIAGAALAIHAMRVESLAADDLSRASGWIAFGGWAFVLQTTRWSYLAIPWLGAALIPLAMIGAMSWKDATGARLAALLAGYTLGFLVIGRPENFYWGLMEAPLIGVGLTLAPEAVAALARQAFVRTDIA